VLNKLRDSDSHEVHFDVDATKLHTDAKLHPNLLTTRPKLRRHYPRVHFNMPYVAHSIEGTAKLVFKFFKSVAQIQVDGDRVYMALVDKPASGLREKNEWFHLDDVYQIANASTAAGYGLTRKKQFYKRYKDRGYKHSTSDGHVDSENDKFAIEFVFRKNKEHRIEFHSTDVQSGSGTDDD